MNGGGGVKMLETNFWQDSWGVPFLDPPHCNAFLSECSTVNKRNAIFPFCRMLKSREAMLALKLQQKYLQAP